MSDLPQLPDGFPSVAKASPVNAPNLFLQHHCTDPKFLASAISTPLDFDDLDPSLSLCGALLRWEAATAECQRLANELPSVKQRDEATKHIDGLSTVFRTGFDATMRRLVG